MKTPWQPDEPIPWPNYPRPQMVRPAWTNLNGWWDWAIATKDINDPHSPGFWQGKILVPFPLESALSGVGKPLLPEQRLWYRRQFDSPQVKLGERLLLHFEAVDFECSLWLNGELLGSHTGGYLPFTFDVTHHVLPRKNELVVTVWDPSDAGLQERGKQSLQPKGIWYTAVSGIWQTAWLEVVPEVSIAGIRLAPDLDAGELVVGVELRGGKPGLDLRLQAEASFAGKAAARAEGDVSEPLLLKIPEVRPWSPQKPQLYDLKLRLLNRGKVVDEVSSYFAMRKFGMERDAGGHLRFTLNHEPLFLYGPLDQGYFPDGLYTAPSDEAMRFDIEFAKKTGCNLIRKHVKVEPRRWYYHCDRLGMLAWQDMPNGGRPVGDLVSFLAITAGLNRGDRGWLGRRRAGRGNAANREAFERDLKGMVDHLYNAACIAIWTPFNEGWGQFEAVRIAGWLKNYDPSRLVEPASGWFDQGGGDIQSEHIYFRRLKPPKRRDDQRAWMISEFGGYSLKVKERLWDEKKKFGYRFYKSPEKLTEAYLELLEGQLKPLIRQGLAGAVYTQTTDVEIEINGYLTYDRQVEKMDVARLRQAHLELLNEDLTGQ